MQNAVKAVAESAKRFVANRISGKPLYVSLEVTESCNADCDFCRYRRSNDGNGRVTENLDSYLETIVALNPIFLGLTGGEPLIRADLEKLVEEAKKKAKVPYVAVSTNGSLLTPERYFSLSEAGLDRLNISLDFANARHDDKRGLPGLYQRIVGFLESVRGEKGTKVVLNTLYMRDNLFEIQKIISLAESYSVQVNLLPYNQMKNGVYYHVAGTGGAFGRLKMDNPDLVANPAVTIANTQRYLESGRLGGCDAGRSFLFVLPNGRLRACIDHPESEGRTLQEIRAYKEVNDCSNCYSTCRSYPEMAVNPLNAVRMALELKNKL